MQGHKVTKPPLQPELASTYSHSVTLIIVDICLVPDGKLFTLFVRFNIFFPIIENNGSLWSFYLLHVIYNFQLASKMWHCCHAHESLEARVNNREESV